MAVQPLDKRSDWIRSSEPRANPRIRLVCCPYAGASASVYNALSAALPAEVEALSVQYPGRPGNRGEPPIKNVGELADRIAEEIRPWLDRPVAVFGHSYGSIVAFEVTRRLEAAGAGPLRLIVSGRRSPSDGLGSHTPSDDQEIIAELKELGGIPPRFFERAKFLEPILAVVKNDYHANSTYLAPEDATVGCPISFLCADADPYLTEGGERGWERHTSAGFRITHFSGGHFFLNERVTEVAGEIAEILRNESL
ncbi:thioesterase II family protein [Streptomyces sp. NPDC012751]|uniref:thioesterase II family protein n=1 Tax=Streptomyces sp. NPDC012751 TaxID=3364846 RepID=UPI0036B01161